MNGHLPIDDLADGAPLDAEASAHLASCGECRRSLEQTRRLMTAARGLGPVEPPRDLWPGIAAKIASRRSVWPWVAGGAGGLVAAACAAVICGGLAWMAGDRSAAQVADADRAIDQGDLVAADLALTGARGPQAAVRRSWLALIRGDTRAAEAELDAVPDGPDRQMRLALIALERGDLEGVERHAARSEQAAGWVLAGEVHLADLDDEKAREWLSKAARDRGVAGETARSYLSLLDEGSLWATANARWALSLRDEAVLMAPDAIRDDEDAATLLVWAGRAAATRHAPEARVLLDAMTAPPEGQAWRWQATLAITTLVEGSFEEGMRGFAALREAGAPEEGLADARATAAAVVDDQAVATALLEGLDTAAAARVRSERGMPASWEPGTALGQFLSRK